MRVGNSKLFVLLRFRTEGILRAVNRLSASVRPVTLRNPSIRSLQHKKMTKSQISRLETCGGNLTLFSYFFFLPLPSSSPSRPIRTSTPRGGRATKAFVSLFPPSARRRPRASFGYRGHLLFPLLSHPNRREFFALSSLPDRKEGGENRERGPNTDRVLGVATQPQRKSLQENVGHCPHSSSQKLCAAYMTFFC